MKVAILSLGYLGLPLAMQFERPNVTGVDLDVV
jgi:UDP-N-acetyl-D-mannosaminuronate dehydrogenase